MRTFANLIPLSNSIAPRASKARRFRVHNPYDQFRVEIDRLFEDFLPGFGTQELLNGKEGKVPSFSPRIDMEDSEEALTVVVELPGLKENEIDLDLTDDFLVITAEKKCEREGKNQFREIEYGWFERRVALPCEIDGDNVKAHLQDGHLTITLPKAAPTKNTARKISISNK